MIRIWSFQYEGDIDIEERLNRNEPESHFRFTSPKSKNARKLTLAGVFLCANAIE